MKVMGVGEFLLHPFLFVVKGRGKWKRNRLDGEENGFYSHLRAVEL